MLESFEGDGPLSGEVLNEEQEAYRLEAEAEKLMELQTERANAAANTGFEYAWADISLDIGILNILKESRAQLATAQKCLAESQANLDEVEDLISIELAEAATATARPAKKRKKKS